MNTSKHQNIFEMKRLSIFAVVMCLACALHAQIVQDNEAALVYYMPETQLEFDIEYVEETFEPGPFCHFAEKYLGAEQAIQEKHTQYKLIEIKTRTHTMADYSRVYKVVPEKGLSMQLLSLTDNGLLYGYNVEQPESKKTKPQAAPKQHKDAYCSMESVMPLLEEQINAPSLQQKADGAAKQIYRIRETRMYLLSGEIEHAPADGKAMERVLRELDKQENQLVELFVGKHTTKYYHKRITYIPNKSEEKALLYFSEENGITAEEDVTAYPLILTISARKQVLSAGNGQASDKKAPALSQLYYNLPGSASLSIAYRGEVFSEYTVPVAQFGIAVPLARDLFTGTTHPRIRFNTKTGNILSIEQ